MSEAQAIELLKKGDIAGLEALVQLYYFKAVRTAYFITRDKFIAEDIVQSAFLRVYDRFYQFDASHAFGPWFLKIISNDSVKQVSRQKPMLSFEQEASAENHSLELKAATETEPEKLLEQAETRREMWEILGQLTPAQRGVIVERYYLDLSENEIASRQGIQPGAVKARLHSARRKLRALISPRVEGNQ